MTSDLAVAPPTSPTARSSPLYSSTGITPLRTTPTSSSTYLSQTSPTSPTTPTSSIIRKKNVVGSYVLGKTLGKGSYSTVKRAYHIDTYHEVAIKIMSPGKCDMEDIDREIAILKLLKHPNIIHLMDVIRDAETNKTYLVFELVNGGDLFDYTIARGRLSEREARRIMREVVSGVAYCHAHMVVHRDLKLENLLMDKDGHARIADFGMSGMMQAGLRMNTFCGSPMYMSPEIVRGLGYGPGVDIWSLGVVLYTIVVGQTPWKLAHAKSHVVEDLDSMLMGKYSIPSHVKLSPECEELISLMIVPEHAKRASIEQIMAHPWMTEGYDQPVTVPLSISPITEVNEMVLKHMIAMGYTEAQTRKAVEEEVSSPVRMVYQHMVQQMEEGFEPPRIPASPRKHSRHPSDRQRSSSTSPRSPRASSTSPRRNLLEMGPMRARAISDSKRILRASSDLPPAPISPRTALTSSWRLAQMSTIREEIPAGLSTETPCTNTSPRQPFQKTILPSLALHLAHSVGSQDHCPSMPTSPVTPPSGSTSPTSPSAPTSPQAAESPSPSSQPILFEEPLVVVRGAFNVATTTLKPRRALLAEIERVLTEANISHTLCRSVFKCKVDKSDESRDQSSDESEDDDDEDEDEDEDGRKLKFDVEVCRVAGLEMLLGVRFQKAVGNRWEYQEICKRLMASMKL